MWNEGIRVGWGHSRVCSQKAREGVGEIGRER